MESWALRCNRCRKPAVLFPVPPSEGQRIVRSMMRSLSGEEFNRSSLIPCGSCGNISIVFSGRNIEKVVLNEDYSSGRREHNNEVDGQVHGLQPVRGEEQASFSGVESGRWYSQVSDDGAQISVYRGLIDTPEF